MPHMPFTQEVIDYIRSRYGVRPEYLWMKTPDHAIFRNPLNRKWFAALLADMPRQTLGLSGEGRVDVINVKCPALMIGSLLDGKRYLPGYHMNKAHWVSLVLDGSIPAEEICRLIDMSYALVERKM